MTVEKEKEKKDKEQAQQVTINEKIRAEELQLITQDGENIGIVPRLQALRMAREAGLDLVLIAERGKDNVPVAKIMDLGKVLYEKKKKLAESKKHQKVIEVKEVKMRPKIGEHDYETKIRQISQFLSAGKKVKITLSFKGRENVQKDERGAEFFDKVQQTLQNGGFGDSLLQEKDMKLGKFWSRIYYLKSSKK